MARSLLRDSRREIVRADAKASSLLMALGIAVAAATTVVARAAWWPANLSALALVLGCLAVAMAGFAMRCLISVILPRHDHGEKETSVIYFADVVRMDQTGSLETAVRTAAQDPLGHTLDQLRSVCWIAYVKHRRVRTGIVSLSLAATLGTIALALGAWHR